MKYDAEDLLDEILRSIKWAMDTYQEDRAENSFGNLCAKSSCKQIHYYLDLYWYKFGVNLRLTNQKVKEFIKVVR